MKNRVVIVGTGFVGMSYAYALLNQGTLEEIILVDIDSRKAEGEAMDLNHGLAFAPRKMLIRSGTYEDCKDAKLVVITAGVNQKDGETRIDLLNRNAKIMQSVVKEIMKHGFNGIFLVATNPVDILTYIVWKSSGLPSNRVIGSGTSLDTARLRYEISQYINIDVRNIHAYILGEHGDSEFVCWSNAFVGVKPLKDVIDSMPAQIKFSDLDKIYLDVKNSAYEIIQRKRATYYGISMALVRITKAIFNNENRILPISVFNDDDYDIDNLYIGLPAVLNENGVDHVVKLNLNDEELKSLKKSSSILKHSIDSITLE
ncbi:L-lactate dehydrogenase [Acholeplasma laidlawii]|uniref:L-lactate dehydrogenase n=1 Tax=Acholeplasma laidlawii TaxID=2148 RepID=A0A553IH71_ACHLA|nr:L-lactate dehydrogenase [Acholeplasma laidlawii]NWH09788.1 L-lactate dehydrogenase [Acholeplasma laidlawii]NWH11178.1 L-lactate dehydrogenase [Acholeplasma laidlawii]NWH13411.1 L-lactate dehydrogenase [Acholeplasma laidlawii]NWH14040.1 L-lactate dehydrogenase [Acholeplasma laidlawii]OAN20422.1 L-lactate dehydrogenase [Acholeplasma laidlawii]